MNRYEHRFACHLVSALRVIVGSSPVELNQFLCGDGLTYGAQAMAETVYETSRHNPSCLSKYKHDTTKYTHGPLAGLTFDEICDNMGNASNGKTLPGIENLGTGGYGGEAALVYTCSGIHMLIIMNPYLNQFGYGYKDGYNCEEFDKKRD